MKLLPIGGKDVAPELPIAENLYYSFLRVCILSFFSLSLRSIFQTGLRYPPEDGYSFNVATIFCSLLYLLKTSRCQTEKLSDVF